MPQPISGGSCFIPAIHNHPPSKPKSFSWHMLLLRSCCRCAAPAPTFPHRGLPCPRHLTAYALILDPLLPRPLLPLLLPALAEAAPNAPLEADRAGAALQETQFAQPALFAVEAALAAVLQECGVVVRAPSLTTDK